MQFIELIFGIAPDGGNGATEMLWLLTVIAVMGAGFGVRTLMRRPPSG